MKKIILGLGIFGMMASSVFSQGLVSIADSGSGLLVSTNTGSISGKATGSSAYYFELLVSTNLAMPASANNLIGNPANLALWTDSGVTGVTGTGVLNAGKILAQSSAVANGVPAALNAGQYGQPFVMIVVGWSASFGNTWASVTNMLVNSGFPAYGFFGTSEVAINLAGGNGVNAVNVWGNQTETPGYGLNSALVLGIGDPLAYDFYIYQQPTNQAISLGGNTIVSVGAGGAPINYQWQFNGTNLPGANNSFYPITNMSPANVGGYDVIMANIEESQTSSVAQITISSSPYINQQPTNGQAFPVGTTPYLTVEAAGVAPLSYQWRSSAGPATVGSGSTLSFPLAQTNNSGSYFVIITNVYGAVTSSPASLTIYQPAAIVTPPAGEVVPNGAPATFTVTASGFPTLTYQWALNGTNIAGATMASLTINAIHLKDLGNYVVLVSNAYSSAQSLAATLSMSPSIISPFAGVSGLWGQGAVLTVGAEGSGNLTYQWFKDGAAVVGATNATYTIPTLQLTDAGLYSVAVSSGFGSVTNIPAQVVVNPADVSLGIYAGIVIQGTIGYSYGIQYSTNLTDTNAWIDATNITLQQPIQIWSDYGSDVRANPKRYYRIQALP
jgi:hypothetical protein